MAEAENVEQVAETAEQPDYKALYEQAQVELDRWKALSKKNEGRAKANASAARELEGTSARLADASEQLADLTKRLEAIETENSTLKANAARAALVKKVSVETGVPEAIVATLAPNDEEALAQAASAIASAYKAPAGAPFVPEAGKFGQGVSTTKTAAEQFADIIGEALGQ